MTDRSPISTRKPSEHSHNAIFSQALGDGLSRSKLLAFRQTSMFGPDHAPVNRFRVPVNAKVRKTNGTCGQNSTASLASAVLSRSLENRLQATTDLNGSMEYRLTWKSSVMQSGRRICRLRASGRRTSDKGFGGWPTPMSLTCTDGHQAGNNRHMDITKKLVSGWPTPCQQDGPHGGPNQGVDRLPSAVHLAGWLTPKLPSGGACERNTPGGGLRKLEDQAELLLNVQTEGEGRLMLNPLFSLWLQGYPEEWACLKERGTA